MYIRFLELRLRNINSYGNKETIFKLNIGLNHIAGLNGEGKSTILDALCFCLYGKPFRKINIQELINRDNKKKLYTETLFVINKDIYSIRRELKPNKLVVTKNKKIYELLPSKSLTQDEINNILGIDITLFRQVISLAINYNKPFLALGSPDKRKIVETIFNITVFGQMLKNIKTENTNLKTEQEINKRNIQILKKILIETNEQYKQYTNKKKTFDKDKQLQLDNIIKKINNTEVEIKELEDNIQENVKYITNISTLQDNTKRIGVVKYNIENINTDLDFFSNNTHCPKCKSDISEEHKQEHIKKNKEELSEYKEEYIQLTDIIKAQNNNKKIKQKLIYINKSLEEYRETKKNITEQQFIINLTELEENLKDKKEEYKEIWDKLNTNGEEITLNEIIIKMLGDEGIRTYFFAKLIPILNQKVNEFLDLFGLPVTIIFNEYMEETIDTYKNKNVSYWSFSEGEKKRIDISILLSFIETTKLISNWGCNLIMFDELLDTSTDNDGLDKIFDAIKEMLNYDSELCVYIISHRDISVDFDGKYTIKKNNGFSSLTFDRQL